MRCRGSNTAERRPARKGDVAFGCGLALELGARLAWAPFEIAPATGRTARLPLALERETLSSRDPLTAIASFILSLFRFLVSVRSHPPFVLGHVDPLSLEPSFPCDGAGAAAGPVVRPRFRQRSWTGRPASYRQRRATRERSRSNGFFRRTARPKTALRSNHLLGSRWHLRWYIGSGYCAVLAPVPKANLSES